MNEIGGHKRRGLGAAVAVSMGGGIVKIPVGGDGDTGHPGDKGIDEAPCSGQDDYALDDESEDFNLSLIRLWVVIEKS